MFEKVKGFNFVPLVTGIAFVLLGLFNFFLVHSVVRLHILYNFIFLIAVGVILILTATLFSYPSLEGRPLGIKIIIIYLWLNLFLWLFTLPGMNQLVNLFLISTSHWLLSSIFKLFYIFIAFVTLVGIYQRSWKKSTILQWLMALNYFTYLFWYFMPFSKDLWKPITNALHSISIPAEAVTMPNIILVGGKEYTLVQHLISEAFTFFMLILTVAILIYLYKQRDYFEVS